MNKKELIGILLTAFGLMFIVIILWVWYYKRKQNDQKTEQEPEQEPEQEAEQESEQESEQKQKYVDNEHESLLKEKEEVLQQIEELKENQKLAGSEAENQQFEDELTELRERYGRIKHSLGRHAFMNYGNILSKSSRFKPKKYV